MRASLVAQTVMNLPAMQGPELDPRVRKISWRREWLSTEVFLPREFHDWKIPWLTNMTEQLKLSLLVFPVGSAGKGSACNAGDLGSIPELERSPGEGKGCPLQYSDLKNFMDCIGHGLIKSQTWLSNFYSLTWKVKGTNQTNSSCNSLWKCLNEEVCKVLWGYE